MVWMWWAVTVYKARLCTAWLVGYPKAVRPLLLMTRDIKG